MRAAALVAIATTLAIGCGGAPEPRTAAAPEPVEAARPAAIVSDGEPIAGIAPDPTPRQAGRFGAPAEADAEGRLKGIRRSRVVVTEIDYEALPRLQPTEGGKGPTVRLEPDSVIIHGDMLGDVEIGSYVASTAGSYSSRNAPSCGLAYEGALEARWSGLVGRSWRDDRVTVVEAEGLFDRKTCEAKPARAGQVEAKAIVPGFIYAYRAVASSDLMPRETLVIIMPHTVEAALTAAPSAQAEVFGGSGYTRMRLPVERGSGMGFVAKMTPGSFDTWRRLRAARSAVIESYAGTLTADGVPLSPLLVGVEVTWQGDKRWVSLQISLAEGTKKKEYAAFLRAAKADL